MYVSPIIDVQYPTPCRNEPGRTAADEPPTAITTSTQAVPAASQPTAGGTGPAGIVVDSGVAVPSGPETYLARGLDEMKNKQYRPAIADFDDVLRLDPSCAAAYYQPALANQKTSRMERALGDLYEAIRLDPQNPNYYFLRGEVAKAMHRHNRAIEDYTMVIRLDPKNSAAKDRLWELTDGAKPADPPKPTPTKTTTTLPTALQAARGSGGHRGGQRPDRNGAGQHRGTARPDRGSAGSAPRRPCSTRSVPDASGSKPSRHQ